MTASITCNYNIFYTFKSNDLVSCTSKYQPISIEIRNGFDYLDEINEFIDKNFFIVPCDEYKYFSVIVSDYIKEKIKNNLNIIDLNEIKGLLLRDEKIFIDINCNSWGNKKLTIDNYFSTKTLKSQGLDDTIFDGMDGRCNRKATFVGEMYKFDNGM